MTQSVLSANRRVKRASRDPPPAAMTLSLLLPLIALAQRPGPGAPAATCASGDEGDHLQLACTAGGKVTGVAFADYGRVTGS